MKDARPTRSDGARMKASPTAGDGVVGRAVEQRRRPDTASVGDEALQAVVRLAVAPCRPGCRHCSPPDRTAGPRRSCRPGWPVPLRCSHVLLRLTVGQHRQIDLARQRQNAPAPPSWPPRPARRRRPEAAAAPVPARTALSAERRTPAVAAEAEAGRPVLRQIDDPRIAVEDIGELCLDADQLLTALEAAEGDARRGLAAAETPKLHQLRVGKLARGDERDLSSGSIGPSSR